MAPVPFRDYRLPRGNHGLSRAQVTENQRWRLIGAASEVLAEERILGVTSRLVARRAGVSSHTFYEHFEDVDDVLAAAFANAAQLLVESTGAAFAAHEDPEGAWGAALSAALAAGADEPGLAALMRIELAVAVPAVAAERERLLRRLAALPDAIGRRRSGPGCRWAVTAALALGVERLQTGEVMSAAETADLAPLLA
jgi:DNA-binding transcriptional regulator YbjK